jgi:hypothetical protein
MLRTLLLITLIAAASSAALSQTKSMASAAAAARCTAAQLKVTPGQADQAMGGAAGENYIITNTGSSPCSLRGFPIFQLLDAHGHPRHTAQATNHLPGPTTQPPQTVTLAPNGPAWFGTFHNSGGAGHMGPPCPTYHNVRVTLPHVAHHFVVADDIQFCAGLQVSAIQSGAPPQ